MILMPALLALALPAAHGAEGYNAHGFTLVPSDGDLHDPLAMWRPELQVKGSLGVNGLFEAAKAPLVRYSYSEGELVEDVLLDNLVGLNLGGSYALNRRVALTLAMPLWVLAEDGSGETHAALGDVRFAAPVGLIMPRGDPDGSGDADAAGFMLSLIPFADLPTGNANLYLGSGGFGGGGVLAAGFGPERWKLFANGGFEYTPAVTELGNLNGGSFVKAGLGASARLADRLALRAEATLNASLQANEVPFAESPAEGLLSLRYRAESGLNLTLGGATAITPGAGAARYRAFAGGGWTFGKTAEEPLASCALTVTVQDSAGSPIRDAQVSSENRVITTKGDGQAYFEDCTAGASQTITAQAPSYQEGRTKPFTPQRGPNERVIVLEPQDARLKVIVLDEVGAPHDGRVRFLSGPAEQRPVQVGPDGEETLVLKPGRWTVLVASPTHIPQEAEVFLDPGEFETLMIRFTADAPIPVCSETVIFHDVNFDFDIDVPREDSLKTLRNVAASLKDCPEVVVEVGGHTDSRGTDAYNVELSQRRVNSVKVALEGYGIPDYRLNAMGYGEGRPMATNETDAGRALNRRVEFVPVRPPTPNPAPPAAPTKEDIDAM